MKFLSNNKRMTYEEADSLIERYYEGLTSAEEEKRLHTFLCQPGLPANYHAEQALFGYLRGSQSVSDKRFRIGHYVYQLAAIAAIALLVVTLAIFHTPVASKNYAYIDGVKVTDEVQIRSAAMASLSGLSNDDVDHQLKEVTSQNSIEQQLGVFSPK